MLKHIQIENYALIEKLEIEFGDGFTVITGETGAGKSILLGALSLILGQRADTQVLYDKNRKCVIEGSFDLRQIGLESVFEEYQLEFDPVSIFRREISPQGKSRAFVNDTPVNLNVLKELAERLIDIHSQHQNLLIGESSFQFDVIDSYSGILPMVNAYRDEYRKLQKRKQALSELEEEEQRLKADLDYFQFQLDELQKTPLNQEDFLEQESELERLRHAGEIKANLERAGYLIAANEPGVIDMLHEALLQIRPLSRFSPGYLSLGERLESALIELKDIGREIDSLSYHIIHDPQKESELEALLDTINKLLHKHHAADVNALVAVRDQYAQKIDSAHSLRDVINDEKQLITQDELKLGELAATVSEKRREAIPAIEKELVSMLQQLGMPGAQIQIQYKNAGELTINGIDQLQFLFSAHADTRPGEIARIASGGELSRLMLCIKSLISQKNLLPSIIFDEIDTGISGEVGGKIAGILKEIAGRMQVIAITHLPQIAARGDHHLMVYKTFEGDRTRTNIRSLSGSDRAAEIAKMLGGENPTPGMLNTAGELLMKNRSF